MVYDEEGNVIEEKDDPNLLQNRPPLQRALVISAGVIANILLTFLLSAGTSLSYGIGHPQYGDGILVTAIPKEDSVAANSGFRVDDVITKVNDQKLEGSNSMSQLLVLARISR